MSSINKIECSICISEYSSKFIKNCPFCNFECCSFCIKKYINNTLNVEKNCMNCSKKLSRSILISLLGKSYINTLYNTNIKEIIFKQEKMLIPRSLPEFEKRKEIRLQNVKIKELNNILENNIKNGIIVINTLEYFKHKNDICAHIEFQKYINSSQHNKNTNDNIKNVYKYPCQYKDCNGFVDSSWKCSICDNITCKYCHIIVEDNHECKQDDIATVALIKKGSKPCPKCNMYIIKSSGCDQMWCVNCHTTFDWKTLIIKTSGVLHNPEYFRYMRDNGIAIARNPNDNPCENQFENSYILLTNINSQRIHDEKNKIYYTKLIKSGADKIKQNFILKYIHDKKNLTENLVELSNKHMDSTLKKANNIIKKFTHAEVLPNNYIEKLFTLYRDINHIDQIEIPNALNKRESHNVWKDEKRLMYLDKEITELEYKSLLIKRQKELEFIEETIGFYETISEVCKIYFINKINNLPNEIDASLKNMKPLELKNCETLIKLIEFIDELSINNKNIKNIYGYTRRSFLPNILNFKSN